MTEKEPISIDCPICGTQTELAEVDVYKCPWCNMVVDMEEDEDGY